MTHKEDLKVISTWEVSYFIFDYATEKGMLFMGTYVLKKKETKHLNGSTMHKYVKPKISFPSFR